MGEDILKRSENLRKRIKDKKNNSLDSWREVKQEYSAFLYLVLYCKKVKFVYAFIGLIFLSSCSQVMKPVPFGLYRGMYEGAPHGSEVFRAGWKDGCESGLAAYGTLHYKATHEYNYDDSMLDNDEYHSSWRLGFRHCRWYTAQWTKFIQK